MGQSRHLIVIGVSQNVLSRTDWSFRRAVALCARRTRVNTGRRQGSCLHDTRPDPAAASGSSGRRPPACAPPAAFRAPSMCGWTAPGPRHDWPPGFEGHASSARPSRPDGGMATTRGRCHYETGVRSQIPVFRRYRQLGAGRGCRLARVADWRGLPRPRGATGGPGRLIWPQGGRAGR